MKLSKKFAVMEFARKTGDLHSLSKTDIRVIALAYTLERELVGTDHIRTEPTKKVIVNNKEYSYSSHCFLSINSKLFDLCLIMYNCCFLICY